MNNLITSWMNVMICEAFVGISSFVSHFGCTQSGDEKHRMFLDIFWFYFSRKLKQQSKIWFQWKIQTNPIFSSPFSELQYVIWVLSFFVIWDKILGRWSELPYPNHNDFCSQITEILASNHPMYTYINFVVKPQQHIQPSHNTCSRITVIFPSKPHQLLQSNHNNTWS